MMPMSLPVTLLLGPPRHGVVQYARDVAHAGDLPIGTLAGRGDEPGSRRVHLHVTDQALAASPDRAAERIAAIAARARLTVTLHDVPQPSDGARNLARRGTAYREIAALARAVAVSSRHEAGLLAEHLGVRAHVIPLGTRRAAAPAAEPGNDPTRRGDVLIAGYIYPGKGHETAIRAAAELGRRVGTPVGGQAQGAVSAGHTDEAERLHALAAALGVRFEIVGFLGAEAYTARLRGPGIPVVAHEHVSASRSLLDWLDAGRRPLVADSPYSVEAAQLRPGTMTRYDALADALEGAWHTPASTTLPPGTALRPSLADAAAAYRHWWLHEVAW
jgi:glycosyltransferase involved in cell wall biosynthesis